MKIGPVLLVPAVALLLASSVLMLPNTSTVPSSTHYGPHLSGAVTPSSAPAATPSTASGTTASQSRNNSPSTSTGTQTSIPASTTLSGTAQNASTISLVQQVENSGHYKLFPAMIAKGPSVKDPGKDHYGDSCIRCHSAVAILDNPNAKVDDFFSGGKYAGQNEGISCRVCHSIEGPGMVTLRHPGWESCGVCHVNSAGDPKPGSEVHHPQFQMIMGVEISTDIPSLPSYKYAYMNNNFSCIDCHTTNEQKHDFMVPGVTAVYDSEGRRIRTELDYAVFEKIFNQDKCIHCHADLNGIVSEVKQQQTDISTELAKLKPIYEEWSKKVTNLGQDDPNVAAFKTGATYYTFVEADGSKGVHNYKYAKALLQKAEAYWKNLGTLKAQ